MSFLQKNDVLEEGVHLNWVKVVFHPKGIQYFET